MPETKSVHRSANISQVKCMSTAGSFLLNRFLIASQTLFNRSSNTGHSLVKKWFCFPISFISGWTLKNNSFQTQKATTHSSVSSFFDCLEGKRVGSILVETIRRRGVLSVLAPPRVSPCAARPETLMVRPCLGIERCRIRKINIFEVVQRAIERLLNKRLFWVRHKL